jgi:CheY-like chemotaxis protein
VETTRAGSDSCQIVSYSISENLMAASRGRILVVDDDPDLRRTIVSLLDDEGYVVVEAANGAEALALLHENPSFSLILFDLVMPVMDGWQLRRELAGDAEFSLIPVVAMSTYWKVGEHKPPQAAAFLQKPFEASVLSNLIKSCARPPTA